MSKDNKIERVCSCGLTLTETTVTHKNGKWQVKYEWDELYEWIEFETEDFSEIKFPPTNMCPDDA